MKNAMKALLETGTFKGGLELKFELEPDATSPGLRIRDSGEKLHATVVLGPTSAAWLRDTLAKWLEDEPT